MLSPARSEHLVSNTTNSPPVPCGLTSIFLPPKPGPRTNGWSDASSMIDCGAVEAADRRELMHSSCSAAERSVGRETPVPASTMGLTSDGVRCGADAAGASVITASASSFERGQRGGDIIRTTGARSQRQCASKEMTYT